ncbi:hypothetical protein [Bradyrhizobium sp. CB2312]|uniref:ATP-dependent DNA ligase n=1 Tax=Bradyrhizobium sp. CB2312 TaxID=3039155 RepID=UPI0032C23702
MSTLRRDGLAVRGNTRGDPVVDFGFDPGNALRGYRLMVVRENDRVRLFTRNGHDWTKRYPLIVEAALKNRQKQFVIDGEAVVLTMTGIPDWDALHSHQHDDEVQLYAFDILAEDGDDYRRLPLKLRKPHLPGSWRAAPSVSSLHRSSRARSAPTCSGTPACMAWKAWCPSTANAPIARVAPTTGSR